jgi:carbamoyltransferase
MTTILGVGNPIHDTGAALVRDGEIVAAVNEGRLSREKRELRFPSASINALLEYTDNIDKVALSSVGKRSLIERLSIERKRSGSLGAFADGVVKSVYQSISDDQERLVRENATLLVKETDLDANPDELAAKTDYIDHHRAHAASGYYTSGFDPATVVTVDSAGDGLSSTAWVGKRGNLERIEKNDMVDSLGVIWTLMPTVFGFKGAKHAGKFMGMAPYCEEVPADLKEILADIIRVDGFDMVNTFSREHRTKSHEERVIELKKIVGEYELPEVARALQERTEEVLTEMVNAAVSRAGHGNVALAGGVFANVKVNQRVYESDAVEGIFIHQNMGDGGLGLGAALDVWGKQDQSFQPSLLDDVYLGPSYNNSEIKNAIERVGLPPGYKMEFYDDRSDLAAKAADLLADGEVVNLFTGGMEYGPRALGNRSILYQPTDPTSIRWLNEHLERTEFMPFAPVTLAEYADECYLGYDRKSCPAADFMTITFDCTNEMQERSPGAVHIDGTARPQIIQENINPYYYRIIDEYRKRTGIPTLVNTSFNMHGEPIVCKPSEAIRSFLKFGTKALLLETTLVTKEEAQ